MTESVENAKQISPLSFSVIMPAFNEQDVVEKTIRDLSDHLSACDFKYEIIAVNDSSDDETEEILRKLESEIDTVRYVNNTPPGGYGFAIRKGLERYKGDAAVIVTADGSDAPRDVEAYFLKIIEGYDCAFGSRFIQGAKVEGYPPFKLFMNRFTNQILSMLLHQDYKDFTNGFKCYRRQVIDSMQPLESGQFNITIELALKAVLGGWKYAVVPTDWTQRDAGESSFKIHRLIKPYATTALYCMSRNYLQKIRR